MSPGIMTVVIAASVLVLLATGLPVAFCMLAVSVIGIYLWVGPNALTALSSVIFVATTEDYLIAMPMFIFMAAILEVSGLGSALYEMMYKWMAGLRGGLAMGTVVVSTLIAAMTGVAATSTIAMGLLAYPEMVKRGYQKQLAIGCITGSGCLGPLIPPSMPMILVGSLGTLSIGQLFFSGVFPGLLTSLAFIVYIGVRSFLNPALGPPIPVAERANWKAKFISLGGATLPILLIIAVLGGIYTGICTPSEAGGVGAFGALLCAAFYRNLTWKNLKSATLTSLGATTMVFWLLITGKAFSSLLGITGVMTYVGTSLISLQIGRWGVLIIMLVAVYIAAMFIDASPIIVICIPLFMPVIRQLGFDPLWFGLVFTMDVVIGFITPPFGINMFYFKGLGHPGVTMADIYRATIPFVLLITGVWILCIVFPQVAVWLPNMMIKKV